MSQCSITDCTDEVRARGLCPRHYGRWQRHGTTDKRSRKWLGATKVCSRCHIEKPITGGFYSSNRGTCKRCASILGTCRVFDISYEEYHIMLQKQENRCAMCSLEFTDRAPCLDHNHKTGAIRGFVCHGCNLVLSLLDKAVEIGLPIATLILRAQKYLESRENRT
jgi:hypothetical protein